MMISNNKPRHSANVNFNISNWAVSTEKSSKLSNLSEREWP